MHADQVISCLNLWSGRGDSNSRPSPWQGDALPLSHFRSDSLQRDGAEGQNRTGDTSIFSAVLYRLSYLGSQLILLNPSAQCQGIPALILQSCAWPAQTNLYKAHKACYTI